MNLIRSSEVYRFSLLGYAIVQLHSRIWETACIYSVNLTNACCTTPHMLGDSCPYLTISSISEVANEAISRASMYSQI